MIRGDPAQAALADFVASANPSEAGRSAHTLILGIGNPLRGDDAAGPMVCARLGPDRALDCADAPERYLGLAADARVARVLLVDAMDFAGAPGEIAFCRSEDLAERFGTTHDCGLAVLARFVEQEYRKPVAVLGIQPSHVAFGAEVTDAVRKAVDKVSAWLQTALVRPGTEAAWTRS